MNLEYKLLLQSIKSIIWNKPLVVDLVQGVEWETFFQLVKKHNVESLVYSVLNQSAIISKIPDEINETWKKHTFFSSINQMRSINKIETMIQEIQEEGIPILALKGIILRNLYPHPEHRTMGDVDFIVHEEHFNRVKEIVQSKGYTSLSVNGIHEEFECGNELRIEVHWRLLHGNSFKEDTELDLKVWERAIPVNLQKVSTLGMPLEEQIIFQCAHMMKHVWYTGFGVRQLCDMAMLLKHYETEIDWQELKKRARKDGTEKFLSLVIATCKSIWEVDMTPYWKSDEGVENQAIEILLEYLLENGVHKHSEGSAVESATTVILNSKGENGQRSLKWLFPTGESVSERYAYAKKYKILLPIAWVHRLCSVCKRYGGAESRKALVEVNQKYRDKLQLMNTLGIIEESNVGH